ncbi:MAG: MotA/TolQ/ExbB proton channel family protein [Planctomycetales bacterium]|nr:MotA/TolQ/ExbB proton channel family protein [Planctomycetales bacterium]
MNVAGFIVSGGQFSMYFKFDCPQCGKNLKVREELIGRKCGCPYCRATITIPQPELEPPPAPPPQQQSGEFAALGAIKSTAVRRKPEAAAPAATPHGGAGLANGTDVGMVSSGLLGLALAAAFLAVVAPMWAMNLYMGDLFFERGWVPFALVFLFGWSVAILLLKSRKLSRQRASMLFDLLPNELAEEIAPDALDKFLAHIRALPVAAQNSFLVNRVLRGLDHFRVRKSTPEVAALVASQSDIDANAVESSYTLLKVFIWAIPILGFIGTVIGISAAVGGFSGSLEQAQDISVLKESLNGVTGGLATAFDTTLIALVMSMLVMFPASSMQKAEEDLLNWVDEYCNENLLKRLDDAESRPAGSGPAPTGAAMVQAINAAMAPHHAEMRAWSQKLETLGTTLSQQAIDGWREIHAHAAAEAGAVEQSAVALATHLSDYVQTADAQQQQAAAALAESAAALRDTLERMHQGLAGLSGVLERLGEQQVIVQQQPRRGWFFSRRNSHGD